MSVPIRGEALLDFVARRMPVSSSPADAPGDRDAPCTICGCPSRVHLAWGMFGGGGWPTNCARCRELARPCPGFSGERRYMDFGKVRGIDWDAIQARVLPGRAYWAGGAMVGARR